MITRNNKLDPAIIIGAPRSGTNMLRDLIVAASSYRTWPCDEINAIWRHGNLSFPTDELTPDHATKPIKKFINEAFHSFSRKSGTDFVLEKTCANSLRVPFVDEVLPNARYVFLARHGLDAALSAEKRWSSKFDLQYTLKKLRYVPATDIPLYGGRHLATRLKRLISGQKALSSWGPKFEGMDNLVKTKSVFEASVSQWQACVDASLSAFANVHSDKVFKVNYEDFVENPEENLAEILHHIGQPADSILIKQACSVVSQHGVNGWKKKLSVETISKVAPQINGTLQKLGYDPL